MLGPGHRVGRYRIEGLLGQGGMGAVYLAEDAALGRRIALKVVRAPVGVTGRAAEDAKARLLREARAAASLEHPNVVAVYDVGEHEGQPFLAMELIAGTTLRQAAQESASWEIRLSYLVAVARALAAAHENGIVHRDIKPENVMVRRDGLVKVLDFGIARRAKRPVDPTGETETPDASLATITAEGVAVGTPLYMSPEQLQGREIDGRADQFAWAVMAYEILGGRPPWRAGDSVELIADILGADPEALERIAPGVPASVAGAVMRALSKKPEARFPTMGDLLCAIESAPTASLETRPETVRRAPTGWGPPRWAAIATGIVAAAAIAMGIRALAAPAARSVSAPEVTASAAADPRALGVAVTDLPSPKSAVPEALGEFKLGIQSWRDGSVVAASAHFDKARELDPALGEAFLRSALWGRESTDAVVVFNEAVARRASLGEHDALLLEAIAPCMQLREGNGYCLDAFSEARRRFPNDSEFAFWHGAQLAAAGRFRDSVSALDVSLELDPKFGMAWVMRLRIHAYLGEIEEAFRDADRCTSGLVGDQCLMNRALLETQQGRCADVKKTAQALLGIRPTHPYGHYFMSVADDALGLPFAAVRGALEQAGVNWPSPARANRQRLFSERLAESQGDFEAAMRFLAARRDALGGALDPMQRADLATDEIALDLEMGQPAEAADAVRAYLELREALTRPLDHGDRAIKSGRIGAMLAAMRTAGRMTTAEVRKERDAWVSSWRQRVGPDFLPYVWLYGYPATVEDADDAREAIDALPSFGGAPHFLEFQHPLEAAIGRVFLLAGRIDDAVSWLERAARSCRSPVDNTGVVAHLWLGEAYAQKDEKDAACASYAAVLHRWGKAKPKSVTAEEAAKRAKALKCPTAAGP